MMVSTTPMAVCETCAIMTGMARANKLRASLRYFCTHTPLGLFIIEAEGAVKANNESCETFSQILYLLGVMNQSLSLPRANALTIFTATDLVFFAKWGKLALALLHTLTE
ncbi:hypothetical protein [Gibbsiella quercinecans]|uniref:hypothetical protein n=1 Tax=Gibbsiella quercinecans TaxID=929813 RepID=UPI00243085F1|nr:hypothetical protein [Gibbsiella quercinecans]